MKLIKQQNNPGTVWNAEAFESFCIVEADVIPGDKPFWYIGGWLMSGREEPDEDPRVLFVESQDYDHLEGVFSRFCDWLSNPKPNYELWYEWK